MTNKPVVFPQYLDNAQQILMVEADDLMPILGGLAIAAIMNMWARSPVLTYGLGFGLGVALSCLYIRSKRNALTGGLQHVIYLSGLVPLNKIHKNGLLRKVIN